MYKAILFALDGEWVTDCKGDTIEDVEHMVGNLGSRWIFYPIPAIIRDYGGTSQTQKIVKAYTPTEFIERRSIKKASEVIANNAEGLAQLF